MQPTRRNVFRTLLLSMIFFGLLTGLVFPFVVATFLHLPGAYALSFTALCLGAGLLVGLVNYLLFHLVISRELDRIIAGMKDIGRSIRQAMDNDGETPSQATCELEVTSNDRLGRVVRAFNAMGRLIDERQREEQRLREIMAALSDSVDLEFIARVAITNIPAPGPWRHGALYIIDQGQYHCLATTGLIADTVPTPVEARTIRELFAENPDEPCLLSPDTPIFRSLVLLDANRTIPAAQINLVPLLGDDRIIGFILTGCVDKTPLDLRTKGRCKKYCAHIQPYLRSALLHRQIQELATLDELSRVLNRRAGMNRLEELLSVSGRHDFPLSLIMLDIDHFKMVNDIHGHQAGDMVIRELCRRLKNSLRREDQIFRYGGEEFIVLLPHIDLTGAALCAERIRMVIRTRPFACGTSEPLPIRISLGLVQASATPREADTLIAQADMALYRAKNNGRDQGVVVTADGLVELADFLRGIDL